MPGATNLDRSISDALSSSIEEAVAPLEAIAERIEDELAKLDLERDALIANRRRVKGILRAIEPPTKRGPRTASKSAPKPGGHGSGKPSEEKQEEIAAWIRERVNGDDDFTIPELARRDDWIGLDTGYVSHILNSLHERGLLRLVKTGHPEFGARTKTWRFT